MSFVSRETRDPGPIGDQHNHVHYLSAASLQLLGSRDEIFIAKGEPVKPSIAAQVQTKS